MIPMEMKIRLIGIRQYPVFFVSSMAIDQDGKVVVAGCGPGAVSYDWWIKKFSADGVEDAVNWNKKVSRYLDNSTAHCVVVDPSGDIYVVGEDSNDWAMRKYRGYGI